MRVLGCLAPVGVLIPALAARAELSEADGLISISVRAVAWLVRFPAGGYPLNLQRDREDGKGLYYMFTNATTGLKVSFYIESAEPCATAEACRDNYWGNRSPEPAEAQLMGRFERNGFACLEFLTEYRVPDLSGGKVEQHHVWGHLVREGYWGDLHLSMMPNKPSDRQAFRDFVDSITVEPKGR